MYTITAPKVRVIFTQVRAYLLCLKTFKFVSFYTHFGMKFKQADCIFCLKLFLPNSCILNVFMYVIMYSKRNNHHRNQFIVRRFQSPLYQKIVMNDQPKTYH